MIKKSISWNDIDGRPCTEDFHFNFTKAEIIELQVSRRGGFAESLEYLAKSDDKKEELAVIKEIILKAYGRRGTDSRQFVKDPADAEAFSHTEAYSNLFIELFTDADKANQFFRELLPEDMRAEADAEMAKRAGTYRPPTSDYLKKVEQPQEIRVADSPVDQPAIEIIRHDEHHPRMSLPSFQALAPEDQKRYIETGGLLDAEL